MKLIKLQTNGRLKYTKIAKFAKNAKIAKNGKNGPFFGSTKCHSKNKNTQKWKKSTGGTLGHIFVFWKDTGILLVNGRNKLPKLS